MGLQPPLSEVKSGLAEERESDKRWVVSFGSPPRASSRELDSSSDIYHQTLRLVVPMSIGGERVRVRISNLFGSQPLRMGAAHVGIPDSGAAIQADSGRVLTFGGQPSVIVPTGAWVTSDSVELRVPALSDLSVSLFVPKHLPDYTLTHDYRTTYLSQTGDHSTSTNLPIAETIPFWSLLTNIEVEAASSAYAVVTFGDSIATNYSSFLARRFSQEDAKIAVVDSGIGGNRLLHDSIGPNALARFDRDAISQAGAKYVILQIGINDIGQSKASPDEAVTAEELIAAFKQLAERARENGLKIFGSTISPFQGSIYFSEKREEIRRAVNSHLRTASDFNAIIDADQVLCDPTRPARLLPAYDYSDHLHLSDAGNQAIANAIAVAVSSTQKREQTTVVSASGKIKYGRS